MVTSREREKDVPPRQPVDIKRRNRRRAVRVLHQSNEIQVEDRITSQHRDRVKHVVADRGRGREREKDIFTRDSVDGEGRNRRRTVGVLHQSDEIQVADRVISKHRDRGRVEYMVTSRTGSKNISP